MGKENIFVRLFRYLKEPGLIFALVIYIITLVGVGFSIFYLIFRRDAWQSILLYTVTCVFLCYSIYLAVKLWPVFRDKFLVLLKKSRFMQFYSESYDYRTLLLTFFSIMLNVGYIVFDIVVAVLIKSVWYGSLAVYYFLLGSLRTMAVWSERRAEKKFSQEPGKYKETQLENYRFCGVFLLVLSLVMTVPVFLMVNQDAPERYNNLTAVVFAAYTFLRVCMAIVNLVRARKRKSPLLRSLRNISFSNALMSVVSLTSALIATFSDDGGASMAPVNAATGFAVCLISIGIGIYMIVYATGNLSKGKRENGADPE